MNEQEWQLACCEIRDQMAKYVWPTVTCISQTLDGMRGQGWGTGNYVSFGGTTYLLTNAHVVEEAVGSHLAHLPGPTDDFVACYNAFLADPWPVDMALMRIGSEWIGATKKALPASCLASHYDPAPDELLFWLGFPGSTASRHEPITDLNRHYTWFGGPLKAPGVPMLTQAVRSSAQNLIGFDPQLHVALHYPADALEQPGKMRTVPNPKGMSGSLLWDTHFVADLKSGIKWSPDHARVCGLLWAAHEKPEVVIATKIEHLRPTLLTFLRHEAAYFNWINRGKPIGEEMIDWNWAEGHIAELN